MWSPISINAVHNVHRVAKSCKFKKLNQNDTKLYIFISFDNLNHNQNSWYKSMYLSKLPNQPKPGQISLVREKSAQQDFIKRTLDISPAKCAFNNFLSFHLTTKYPFLHFWSLYFHLLISSLKVWLLTACRNSTRISIMSHLTKISD